MKATIKWLDNVTFVGESSSGHSVVMDGPPDQGGRNVGIRPMEMLLIGMGGCTAFDVLSILKKSKQVVLDCQAELQAERADTIPSVFKSINIHFKITGTELSETSVKRAIELSAEKYCSASIMLQNGGVDITHSYELIES